MYGLRYLSDIQPKEFPVKDALNYQIGYFGIPGRDGGKTHLTVDRKPCCKMPLHKDSEFQWCSHGFNSYIVECKQCRKIQQRLENERLMSSKLKFDMHIRTKHVANYGFIPSSMFSNPKEASVYYRIDPKARQITIVSNYVPKNISRYTLTPAQFRKYQKGELALVPPHCCCAHDIDHLDNPDILYSGDFNNAWHLKQIFKTLGIQPKTL